MNTSFYPKTKAVCLSSSIHFPVYRWVVNITPLKTLKADCFAVSLWQAISYHWNMKRVWKRSTYQSVVHFLRSHLYDKAYIPHIPGWWHLATRRSTHGNPHEMNPLISIWCNISKWAEFTLGLIKTKRSDRMSLDKYVAIVLEARWTIYFTLLFVVLILLHFNVTHIYWITMVRVRKCSWALCVWVFGLVICV